MIETMTTASTCAPVSAAQAFAAQGTSSWTTRAIFATTHATPTPSTATVAVPFHKWTQHLQPGRLEEPIQARAATVRWHGMEEACEEPVRGRGGTNALVAASRLWGTSVILVARRQWGLTRPHIFSGPRTTGVHFIPSPSFSK
ncbi:hypothetical protein BC828DRAFT_436774 [Blastocladiella britannica]|nr:hypothetical protein BC828DRAFT_436774 [Blastocladiella britannica]